MLFPNTISLILALAPVTIFAAPTKTVESFADFITRRNIPASVVQKLEDGKCDLSGAKMPIAPTPLPSPAPGLTLHHVAFGIGTQNYTCANAAPTTTPVQVGAMAQLYNVTCQSVRAPDVLLSVPALALDHGLPATDVGDRLLSGHHFFVGANPAPYFTLDTPAHKYGYIQAKKTGASNAPANAPKGSNGLGSVPWLKLEATEGDYKEVYRISTAGGQAPKNCVGIEGDFQIQYSTLYYFWK